MNLKFTKEFLEFFCINNINYLNDRYPYNFFSNLIRMSSSKISNLNSPPFPPSPPKKSKPISLYIRHHIKITN